MAGQRTNDVRRHEPASGCPSLLQPMHGTNIAPHERAVEWPRGATDCGDPADERTESADGRAPSRTGDTTTLVLSRAVHLIDAAVQHLQACLEQEPAGATTEQVRDIIAALHEAQALAEACPPGPEPRPPQRT